MCSSQSGPTTAAGVTSDKAGQVAKLTGKVAGFRASRKPTAPNSFTLTDSTGKVRVAVWPDVFAQVANPAGVVDGAMVNVEGNIADFKGAAEIHVDIPAGLTVSAAGAISSISPTTATPFRVVAPAGASGVTSISMALGAEKGTVLTVSGVVEGGRRGPTKKAPWTLKVGDGSGSIDVVFWEPLASSMPAARRPATGDRVRVTGTAGAYRGTPQLKLDSAEDLKTAASDPELFAAAGADAGGAGAAFGAGETGLTEATPGAVAGGKAGARMLVSGRVTSVEPVRLGRRVTLSGDKQGGADRGTVLLWDSAVGLKPAALTLTTGTRLRVAGRVADTPAGPALAVVEPRDLVAVEP